MNIIMTRSGAAPVDWAYKTECCGAGLSVSRTDLVVILSGDILEDAVIRGTEARVVACPRCHSNLGIRRKRINKYLGKQVDIPVVYITQAIGLALGIIAKELVLQMHFVHTIAIVCGPPVMIKYTFPVH